MDSIDHAISQSLFHLRMAIPNSVLWSGAAASACASAIESLIAELATLQERLRSWAM